MRSINCAVLAVLLSVSAASAAFAAASLTPLGDLSGGQFRSDASGVSDDGSVVVGSSSYSASGIQAFRWTRDGGMVGLGDLPGGGALSWANGVSADGSVIVGAGVSASGQEAFRWTSGGGMVGLGYPSGQPLVDPFSVATGVSGDGSVVVGVGSPDTEHNYPAEAFRWASGGMGGLGELPGLFFFGRQAYGVSHDGSVIVGVVESTEGYEAFRWTSDSGTVTLDGHPLSGSSGAYGVNADGSVVVGFSNSATGAEAFRWTSDGGMVGLGLLPGHVYSEARGVSGDGSVVVGVSDSDDNFGNGEAFRWTNGDGMERLWDVLVGHGVDPAADGWTTLGYASGISADGRTIVGNGVRNGHGEAFAAFIPIAPDLPGDFNFDGDVDGHDFLAWQRNPGVGELADWQVNFGASSVLATNVAVPEPRGQTLIILAASALVPGRRRH
jgi:probable HAF family extracellular repeat protein